MCRITNESCGASLLRFTDVSHRRQLKRKTTQTGSNCSASAESQRHRQSGHRSRRIPRDSQQNMSEVHTTQHNTTQYIFERKYDFKTCHWSEIQCKHCYCCKWPSAALLMEYLSMCLLMQSIYCTILLRSRYATESLQPEIRTVLHYVIHQIIFIYTVHNPASMLTLL